MTAQYFAIGTSYAGLVNVESLTTQAANMSPRVEYRAYRETVIMAAKPSARRSSSGILDIFIATRFRRCARSARAQRPAW
jgi:hypothetical protein